METRTRTQTESTDFELLEHGRSPLLPGASGNHAHFSITSTSTASTAPVTEDSASGTTDASFRTAEWVAAPDTMAIPLPAAQAQAGSSMPPSSRSSPMASPPHGLLPTIAAAGAVGTDAGGSGIAKKSRSLSTTSELGSTTTSKTGGDGQTSREGLFESEGTGADPHDTAHLLEANCDLVHALRSVRAQARSMLGIVNDLGRLDRIERGLDHRLEQIRIQFHRTVAQYARIA
ncbi:hypothetical protein BC828DRAFT_394375 [Blastocladiella britannica]|nr:hypothetical protein BC828DRAFT_394375 [Blastocladiella britannica]